MNLIEMQAQHRRGRILAILAASNASGCNVPMLRTMIRNWGYQCDEDTQKIDLAWLSRHGLVTLRDVAGLDMARITDRGRDVASGDLDLPGVERAEA
jgi:hypothetical protein